MSVSIVTSGRWVNCVGVNRYNGDDDDHDDDDDWSFFWLKVQALFWRPTPPVVC